jgi:hypothetical protein
MIRQSLEPLAEGLEDDSYQSGDDQRQYESLGGDCRRVGIVHRSDDRANASHDARIHGRDPRGQAP